MKKPLELELIKIFSEQFIREIVELCVKNNIYINNPISNQYLIIDLTMKKHLECKSQP